MSKAKQRLIEDIRNDFGDDAARAVLEKSLRHVIPRIKDHPAIHSLCLSNEPICTDLRHCRVTAKDWPAWLERHHGTIAALNQRWGTSYADFASVPVPKPMSFRSSLPALTAASFSSASEPLIFTSMAMTGVSGVATS